ncbi:PQQ-dependent sugar dehydrogenase [Methylohalobius crimeensis]|uniref:PQQ-dependent sugar dehydrogenase n=1 Tax=Methylohalobius crimeensis TaxID=244365 RepID=UPI0003B6D4CE|nr:PQQ-dependent sugar dehydrogenase [Methylohalobius crimeensis]
MIKRVTLGLLWIALAGGAAADTPTCDADNGGLKLAKGFCALVAADNLGRVRHLAVADNGDAYVALRGGGSEPAGVVGLRDTDGDGRFDQKIHFGPAGGTGIGIHREFLYYGTSTRIVRWRLDGNLKPESPMEVVVDGFPSQRSHRAKTFTFDTQGNLYVNVGAPSNSCQEKDRADRSPGKKPCPQLKRAAGIWQFKAFRSGQTQVDDGKRYATGIRNAVAIAWNPWDDQLYTVQHGRDQLGQNWGFSDEKNAEAPSEELQRVTAGADFGWPYCYHDPAKGSRVKAPEYADDDSRDCSAYPAPEVAFPGHFAPNDLLFYTDDHFPAPYRNGAFIAFHGSWNRAPLAQRGYKVVFVPLDGAGRVTGKWEVFADGFAGVSPLRRPGQAKHRPMGLAQGPDGTLYISDSVRGRIWRVIHR